MVIAYGVHVGPRVFFLPLFILLAVVISLGVGLWLSAVNVSVPGRALCGAVSGAVLDVRHADRLLQHNVARALANAIGLNPMAGVVEGFRWSLLGANTGPGPMIAVSSLMSVLILLSGAFYFRRMEKHFADMLSSRGSGFRLSRLRTGRRGGSEPSMAAWAQRMRISTPLRARVQTQ